MLSWPSASSVKLSKWRKYEKTSRLVYIPCVRSLPTEIGLSEGWSFVDSNIARVADVGRNLSVLPSTYAQTIASYEKSIAKQTQVSSCFNTLAAEIISSDVFRSGLALYMSDPAYS